MLLRKYSFIIIYMFTDREINMDFSLNNLGYKHDESKGENEGIDILKFKAYLDNVTNKTKYIFTSVESIFKSKSDEKKFNKARQLKRKAKSIREQYENDLLDESIRKRQLATALYFIDQFALRVGGKKNVKEKADTVGVTSLRVEHIEIKKPNILKMDFLGKDSIRYCKRTTIIKPIFDNLEIFLRGKSKKDQLFDKINSSKLNNYLNSFMDGLTAKVWRTYNASTVFQKEIDKINKDKVEAIHESERINYLVTMFNQAK